MTNEIKDSENTALWLEVKSRFVLRDEIDIDNRVLTINGEITRKSYVKFDKQLRFLEAIHTDPILVIINSPGGSVYDGFAFMDRILNCTCLVNTQAMGLVASAAFPIFLAGDKRTTGRFTTFMHHSMSYGVGNDSVYIHANELVHSKNLENRFNKFIASRTLKPYSFWVSNGKVSDFYFDADKAIELGVVHEIL